MSNQSNYSPVKMFQVEPGQYSCRIGGKNVLVKKINSHSWNIFIDDSLLKSVDKLSTAKNIINRMKHNEPNKNQA